MDEVNDVVDRLENIDAVAAQVILQDFLDAKENTPAKKGK